MKSVLFFSIAGLLAVRSGAPVAAQAPAWQSVQGVAVAVSPAAGSSNYSAVTATAPDGAGNVYVGGSFRGTVALGSLTLTNPGTGESMFVAKWLPASGRYAWAVQRNGDFPWALALSGSSVYVAAGQNGSGYVAKLADAGTSASFTWVLPTSRVAPTALAVSGANVYLSGSFSGTATLGSTTLTNPDIYPDAFVAKVTDAGTTASFGWARSAGVVGSEDFGTAVVASGSTVYVAGLIEAATPVFGSPAPGLAGAYLVRLIDNGSSPAFNWVTTLRDRTNPNEGAGIKAMALNSSGLYLTGSLSGTVDFGTTTLVGTTNRSGFVAKLTDTGSAGIFAWATPAGSGTSALAVTGPNLYVAGTLFGTTATFGGTVLTNSDPAGSSPDAFVAKLTDAGTSGTFRWAKSAGGAGNTGPNPSRDRDDASAIALSGNTVFVAGRTFCATASFAPLTLTNPTGNSIGFLASLADPTLAATPAASLAAPATCFPSPAHGSVRVSIGAARQPLALLDALGREVRRYPAPAGAEVTLDLRGLPAGVYGLRSGSASQRLVVE